VVREDCWPADEKDFASTLGGSEQPLPKLAVRNWILCAVSWHQKTAPLTTEQTCGCRHLFAISEHRARFPAPRTGDTFVRCIIRGSRSRSRDRLGQTNYIRECVHRSKDLSLPAFLCPDVSESGAAHPDSRHIGHRNDIPSELKREIKQSLQNKLHRCAGPEDLATSAGLLERITAPGANYSPVFVEQFKIFITSLGIL
jgi:hypothetical protein